MSDVSLDGSALTSESPIQIVALRGPETKQRSVATEEDIEPAEVTQLMSCNKMKDSSRQISKACTSYKVLIYNNNLGKTCSLFMLYLGGRMGEWVCG
jgi:hypothetical protein